MNQINWKVRTANKTFWLSLIPAALLLVQVVASVFGFTLDLGELGNKLLEVVNALFCGAGDSRSSQRPDHRGRGGFPKGHELRGPLQSRGRDESIGDSRD